MPRKRTPLAIFVNAVDNFESFEEIAEELGIGVDSAKQRYYKEKKKYPGIFKSIPKMKFPKKGDPLDELAELRGITRKELDQDMAKRAKLEKST